MIVGVRVETTVLTVMTVFTPPLKVAGIRPFAVDVN